jgi:N-acyl-D-amino-acid deacylase
LTLALQLEGTASRPGGALLRSFSLDEADFEAFAMQPWTATSSDGGLALPQDGPEIHPRYYGTFPRKIRRYAIERRAISVEHAIRSMTSLPASILGLTDRGTIRVGAIADIAVIDLDRLTDKATVVQPHQLSEGVDYVLINGVVVVDGGRMTWQLPGRVLRRQTMSR